MATIPRIVAQRSLDPGGSVQIPTGDPVGQALEQAGTKVQSLVERYQDRVYQQERFQAISQLDEFSAKIEGEKLPTLQSSKPGALGFHDDMLKKYDDQVGEFLNTIPESQRGEMQQRLKVKRQELSNSSARTEQKAYNDFQVTSIGNRTETAKQGILQSGPDAIDAYQKDVEELVNASTLPQEQKDALKLQLRQTLQETGYRALAERDPEAAQRVAKGWGVDKGFSGSAMDRTMQLLRDKEGFKAGTYWDVNADRVGYGSDTITAPDGSVRTVKRGDTVTREDAERDLRRRTQESLGQVQKAVGDEAFNRLSPNQQAALGSVAYNYGRVPDSVAAAVRTGDAERIAQSIEGLQDHNNGVNRSRRLSEAALARSSGDGPVRGVYQADARFDAVPADRRFVLAGAADREMAQRNAQQAALDTKAYNDQFNSLQTAIIDNKAGVQDVEQARKDGWLKDAGDILRLQSQIATRDKGQADTVAFGKAFADPAYPWNPVNKDQKDWADAGFKSLGGDMNAMEAIVTRTGIVPASAAVTMRGALVNPNPQVVQNALQTAANLTGGRYPDIFAGVEGGKDLTDAGLTFRHLVYDRGMTAADATRKIMEERTPEFERTVKAKIKSEDVNAIVKKEITDKGIRGAFDESWIPFNDPKLGFNPGMSSRAMGDYEESFKDYFVRNGDVDLSKKLAQAELKKTWGVTEVNGAKTLMKFPPERSPVYQGIENLSDKIANQAIKVIKDANGVDVQKGAIQIDEVKNTGERFMRGQPPTYVLTYTDKNGNPQTIPGQFYADPVAMREEQTADRARQSQQISDDYLLSRSGKGLPPDLKARRDELLGKNSREIDPAETSAARSASEAAAGRLSRAQRSVRGESDIVGGATSLIGRAGGAIANAAESQRVERERLRSIRRESGS